MSSPLGAPPGPASLPAWKRALLERKRAKLAGGAAACLPAEPRDAAAGTSRAEGGERLVVAESLGPLRENPFMRLEGERRRRRGRRAAPSGTPWLPPPAAPAPPAPSLSRLLELYSAMPGIRTIRADNILIIESRPGEEDAAGEEGAATRRRRGAGPPVTEIRAGQVVIYEPGKEELLPPPASPPPAELQPEPEPGTVSRLLRKFDQQRGGGGGAGRRRGGEAPPAVPNAGALPAPGTPVPSPTRAAPSPPPPSSPVPPSGSFLRKTGSNSFRVNPRGCRPAPPLGKLPAVQSNGPSSSPSSSEVTEADGSPAARAQGWRSTATPTKPTPSAYASPQPGANVWKPKPEGAVQGPPPTPATPPCASLGRGPIDGPSRPPALLSSGCSFEIHPAPKPDLAAIAAHDLQAQALASLRLNSRNSFLFVPRRKGEAAPAPPEPKEAPPAALEKLAEAPVPVTYIDEDLVSLEPDSLPPLKVLSPRLEGFDVPHEGPLAEMEDAMLPTYRSHPPGTATPAQKSGSTFTIVPKRRPLVTGLETFSRVHLREEEEEEEEKEEEARAKAGAPHQNLGRLLKKRYPTVNEIEVIGGYLSLDRSCMSKSGSRRKKLKISFNESRLQTMFEYPSESSLVEEEEEYATEVDEPDALSIPRPSTTISGFSRHSTQFSKWQEEMGASPGSFPQEADLPDGQVMLTPADQSSLSDFGSEPALYF